MKQNLLWKQVQKTCSFLPTTVFNNQPSIFQNAELRKQLTTLQNELQESVQRQEAAIANEQTARRDCQDQAEVAEEVIVIWQIQFHTQLHNSKNESRKTKFYNRICI